MPTMQEFKKKKKEEDKKRAIIRSEETGEAKLFKQDGKFFGGTKEDLQKKSVETEQQKLDLLKLPQKSLSSSIKEDPSQFGLLTPGQEVPKVEGVETIEKQKEERTKADIAKDIIFGNILEKDPISGEARLDPTTGQPIEVQAGVPPLIAPVSSLPAAWNVGGKVFSNPTKAVQAGNAAKNSAVVRPLGKKIFNYGVGAFALLTAGEKLASYFTGRQIDEQQQAVNTLGQMATTIGGDSTEATGDWRKGLEELNYIKSQVLYLESAIKAGTIASAAVKFNGKIYDINADMADQLATIDEQIRIIQSFAIQGQFPELSELEIQGQLRTLEEEGYLEPVDLTTSRRETGQQTTEETPTPTPTEEKQGLGSILLKGPEGEDIKAGTLPIGLGGTGVSKFIKGISDPKVKRIVRGAAEGLKGKSPKDAKTILQFVEAGADEAGDLKAFEGIIKGKGFSPNFIKELKEAFIYGGAQPL